MCESKMQSMIESLNIEKDESQCCICLEVVASKDDPRYGILRNSFNQYSFFIHYIILNLIECVHCVCLECIRSWRQSERMDNAKVLTTKCRYSLSIYTISWSIDMSYMQRSDEIHCSFPNIHNKSNWKRSIIRRIQGQFKVFHIYTLLLIWNSIIEM